MRGVSPDLALRLAEVHDLEFIMAAERDPEAASVITVRTLDQHLAAIEGADEEVLIVDDRHGDAVGFALLEGMRSRHRNIEIRTIVITRRGEGIGKRALRLILARAFGDHGAHRVWLDAVESNERALHTYRAVGFTDEGAMREAWRTGEHDYEDILLLSMLDREWAALRGVSPGEAEDQLGRLERDVELRAVADAVELDPVGVRQPVVAEARGRRRPGEDPVVGPPDDPHRAGDPLGVEVQPSRSRELDQRPDVAAVATPRIWWASSSAGMCS